MNTETYEYLITIEELCEMLSIGKNTAYRLLKTNQIKAFKIERIWYFFGTFLDFLLLPCYTIPRCKAYKNQGLSGLPPIPGVK